VTFKRSWCGSWSTPTWRTRASDPRGGRQDSRRQGPHRRHETLRDERVRGTRGSWSPGGSGFLGPRRRPGCSVRGRGGRTSPFASARHDLRLPRRCAEVVAGQDLVIPPGGHAGGIGWNREAHPAPAIYDNRRDGDPTWMEESRKAGVKKFVQIGTVCAYPFQPPHIPLPRGRPLAGYPSGPTPRTASQEGDDGDGAGVPAGVRFST